MGRIFMKLYIESDNIIANTGFSPLDSMVGYMKCTSNLFFKLLPKKIKVIYYKCT